MLPQALAPPERHAHLPGEEGADGEPRFELLEAGAPACSSCSPRPDVGQGAGVRSRTPTHRGEDRERHLGATYRGHLSVPGCSPGAAYRDVPERQLDVGDGSRCVGDAGGVPRVAARGERSRRAAARRRRTGTPASCSAPRTTSLAPSSASSNRSYRTMPRCGRGQVHVPDAATRSPGSCPGSAPGTSTGERSPVRGAPRARHVVRPVVPSRRVGVRDRYAGVVLGAAGGVRASPGTVPRLGTSLAGRGTGARPRRRAPREASAPEGPVGGTAPGHRPVRPPHGPGERPWLPRGARSATAWGAPRRPVPGPGSGIWSPGAAGEPLGDETPSLVIARGPGRAVRLLVRRRRRRGSPRTSSRRGVRGSPCSSSNRRTGSKIFSTRSGPGGGVPGCSPGATYRLLAGEPGGEGVDEGDCSGLNSSPGSQELARLRVRVGPLDVPGAGTPAPCRVPLRRGPGGAPVARWHRWSRRPRGPVRQGEPRGAWGPPEGSRGQPGAGGEPQCREGEGGA